MTDNDLKNPSPNEEIEMLLPWYVTGEISKADRARVDAYLKKNPEANSQLALVAEELEGADINAQALGAPRAGALGRLLTDIEAADGPAIVRANAPSLGQRLGAWLPSFGTPAMQFTGFAAAFVIIAQAVVIGNLVGGNGSGAQYETASEGTVIAEPGTRLLMSFNPDATAQAITALLQENGAAIVDGPKGSGLFEVRISEKQLSEADIERVIASLKAKSKIIRFVAKAQ